VNTSSPGKWHATFFTAAPFDVTSKTTTYPITVSDFAKFRTFRIPSGTFTMTLPPGSAMPGPGQFLHIINYGSGVVTLAPNGQTLNGGSASLTLGAASATAPTSLWVVSDGINFYAWIAGAVTGGANKGTVHLPPYTAKLPTTNAPEINGSANFLRLNFDSGTSECATWQFMVPQDYGTAPSVRLDYTSAVATGGIAMDFSVMAAPVGGAGASIYTTNFAPVNTCTDAAVPTVVGAMKQLTCALTNNGGLAAGQMALLQACRNVAHATDNANGDLQAVGLLFEFVKN
jgi:hypothetical protein